MKLFFAKKKKKNPNTGAILQLHLGFIAVRYNMLLNTAHLGKWMVEVGPVCPFEKVNGKHQGKFRNRTAYQVRKSFL